MSKNYKYVLLLIVMLLGIVMLAGCGSAVSDVSESVPDSAPEEAPVAPKQRRWTAPPPQQAS